MKTNKEIAKEIAVNDEIYGDSDNNSKIEECFIAAMQMAQIKDRQFAEIVKAKADKMYAKSEGGGSYDDRADALAIYGFLADFYHDLTGESL